jgi:hypothetical protein
MSPNKPESPIIERTFQDDSGRTFSLHWNRVSHSAKITGPFPDHTPSDPLVELTSVGGATVDEAVENAKRWLRMNRRR